MQHRFDAWADFTMKAIALTITFGMAFALAGCGQPLPDAPNAVEVTPIARIVGSIGPVEDIDASGKLATSDGGYGFSATVTAETPTAWVMTRLSVRDGSTLVPGFDRTFTYGNDDGVAMVGCAGSAEGRWDVIDAPADVIHVQIDDEAFVSVTAQIRGSETLTETHFTLTR